MDTSRPWRMLLIWTMLALATGAWAAPCERPGRWIEPETRSVIPVRTLYPQLAAQQVVLLGEHHDNAEHHRWQLHTLAALHAHNPDLVLGFEMFPRSLQPVLDRWVAGELDEAAFLQAVDWEQVWGFDPALYTPLFHFARLQQVPMVALNVGRSLVRAVGQGGWDSVPAAEREGVGDPAPASEAYRQELASVYRAKQQHGHGASASDESAFQHFVEAQLTWDRAMAEALAEARGRHAAALAVGILGQGHVLHGHGVPHQLRDLGLSDIAELVPLTVSRDCKGLTAGMARAVFTVPEHRPPEGPPPPRLGVMIEAAEAGVLITQVVDDSVAAGAGLQVGDVVQTAAGEVLGGPGDLIRVVQRQSPGTWLPLAVRRDGEVLDVVARFPPASTP